MPDQKLVKRTIVEEYAPDEAAAPVEGLDPEQALEGTDAANEDVESDDLGEVDEDVKPTAKTPRTQARRSRC